MDDPFLYPRRKSDATAVEFADDGDHVAGDTVEQTRVLAAQADSEGSTIEPITWEALREGLKTTQLTIKDSVAAASAPRGEMDSLSARANEIGVAYSSVQEEDESDSYFRPESGATVVEFADDGIEPITWEALREELKTTRLTIKDSLTATSALRSEIHSLSARATEIRAEYSSVQETARGALERDATLEQRLGAIESWLGPLGDLEDVHRELEKRFDALNALAQEVRASTDAVNRQRGLVEQLAVETAAQLRRREQRDVELGRGVLVALRANVSRSSPSLTGARNAAWRVERKLTVAIGNLRRSFLSMHVAETMANLRVPKTIGLNKYVAVAAVFPVLALVSAFVLHSVKRTADLVGPPVITPTAPVPSTAVPDLPSNSSATTSSEGSLDSATTVQSLTSTRQAASVDFETPATRRANEFVGILSIRSTPDKAEVRIDRERVGETPLILRRLRAGSHAIWIEHEGYQRWTAGVNVPVGERTQVTATLQAEPGR